MKIDGDGKESEEQDRRVVVTRSIGLTKYRNIGLVHTLYPGEF